MVQRPVAMAGVHVGTGCDGAQDVGPRLLHRLRQRQAQRQVRGNGGRQRAAGAVAVVRGNARRLQAQVPAAGHGQHVHHQVARQVPALEQHRRRAQRQQRAGGFVQRIGAVNAAAQQQRGLVQVRRDDGDPRKQLLHQHAHRLVRHQPVAAGGHHHRVEYHLQHLVAGNGLDHHAHHFGVVQHADLHRVHANVLGHGVDLRTQHVGRNAVDGAHALGVLRGDGGDGRHAVAAERAEGLEVGLDAGAAAAVGAGNGKHPGIACGTGGHRRGWVHRKNYGLCTRPRWAPAACAVILARTKQGCPATLDGAD